MHDALDTRVKIVFVTHRYGQQNYQLELQYYGAYVPPPNKQVVILISPSSVINIHSRMLEENAFQSFHFISNSRINIVLLQAINLCREEQLICYDGPGIKSPVLQSTYNQSEWECQSNTFQMVCTFSKADKDCTKVTHLHYKATSAPEYHVRCLTDLVSNPIYLNESDSRGTNKYIYCQTCNMPESMVLWLLIENIDNMLYEGISCLYGGLYIFQTLSSKHSEILSICTSVKMDTIRLLNNIMDLRNISVVIIHYSAFSSAQIGLKAEIEIFMDAHSTSMVLKKKTYLTEETLNIIVPNLNEFNKRAYLHSSILNLRKIQYVNVSLGNKDTLLLYIDFDIGLNTCTTMTMFYHPHLSNIRGRQYTEETIRQNYKLFYQNFRHDFIRSILFNISACNFTAPPCFTLDIYANDMIDSPFVERMINSSQYYLLPTVAFNKRNIYYDSFMFRNQIAKITYPAWAMVHMIKPHDVPSYAIWKVWIETYKVSHVSFEFILDDYQSSSVYELNYLMYEIDLMDQRNYLRNTDGGFYMAVDKVVNILFVSNHWYTHEYWQDLFSVWFVRHFIHDDKTANAVAGQTLQRSYFTFHNQR